MKYLFIGAHYDDLELSCGGTIIKVLEQGHEVTMVTMSHVYNGLDLLEEWKFAQTVIKPTLGVYQNFNTRYFKNQRQDILDFLVRLEKPDFVFTHSPNCMHQDHSTLGEEVIRAFKNTSIATFQQEWNSRTQNKNYFEKLEKRHVEKKIQVLSCFKSQENRPYLHSDFTWSNCMNNGVAAGTKYAESFNLINLIQ